MNRPFRIVIMLLGLALVAGCHHAETHDLASALPSPSPTLAAIDSLMWQQPDSALQCLLTCRDAMLASPNTPNGDSMETHAMRLYNEHYYQLLAAELLFKNDCAQTNRTELLQAVAYFDSLCGCRDGVHTVSTDPTIAFLTARAHYINSAGYYEQGDLVNACAEYLNTLRIMESHFAEKELVDKKSRFMALTYNRLMELFSKQFMQEPAIYCGKQGLVYTRIAPTSPYGVSNVLYRIGKQYDKLNEADSAVYYYDKALELIPDRNNMTYRDIVSSRALFEFVFHGDATTALDSLKSMAEQSENEAERLNRYRTIGSVYYGFEQDDSAKFYLMPVFESENEVIDKKIAARLLRDIALIEGDTLKANEYALIVANEGASAAENQAQVSKLNDIFQNYMQEKQEAASLRERRKAVRLTLMVLVPLLVAIGLAVAIVMRRSHKKRLAAQEAEAQRRLDEVAQMHDAVERELQTKVDDALQQARAMLPQRVNDLYRSKVPNRMERVMDEFEAAYPGAMERVAATYPHLTKTETQLFMLSFLQFRAKEEADLLGLSQNTVLQYRYNLRKKTENASISSFLEE